MGEIVMTRNNKHEVDDDGPMLSRREVVTAGLTTGVAAMTAAVISEAAAEDSTHNQESLCNVKALTFDVFGTVVDWRSSVIREGQLLAERKGLDVDWEAFADGWRAGYGPAMNRVRTGDLPWMKINELHRLILVDLLEEFGVDNLSSQEIDEFNRSWHRLLPWPDSVPGLNRLKSRFVLATLSNGNVSLLTNMAKNAGLPWDCVLSAELAHHYKPDREVYATAADLLDLPAENIMMVAAHKGDLRAAQKVGFKAGFVPRPLEYGPDVDVDTAPEAEFDVNARDFLDLAAKLGA
jgi:2-haloacid dehalogenase